MSVIRSVVVFSLYRVAALIALCGLLLLGLPSAVLAQETLVSTDVQTVSGVELVSQLARGLTGVEIGREVTTLTVDVDGQMVQMPVDYSMLLGSTGDPGAGALIILAVFGGLFLRFLGLLIRLGR